jgi:glycosyltransferase involved in cell wall biosynthesis
MSKKFSILITTKNRLNDLKFTLSTLKPLLCNEEVEIILYDDASTDGTHFYIKTHYPQIKFFRNQIAMGLIHNRNVLLNSSVGDYAISLDDDSHFLSENYLGIIQNYFENHPKCGVIAFKIYWGRDNFSSVLETRESPSRVKSFVGCGHVWNLKAWRSIPKYPEWFEFYGEEEFASMQLYRSGWEIHYVPSIFVQHRVQLKLRKFDSDYIQRQRRSLRSGWYLYFLFYPTRLIPKKILYSFFVQVRNKVFRGDLRAATGLILAVYDFVINIPRLINERKGFSEVELNQYLNLNETKIYSDKIELLPVEFEKKFSIVISTKDRLEDLKITLNKCSSLLSRNDVEFIICDDGSTDGTYEFLIKNYPTIQLLKNNKSKGYIFSRNLLISKSQSEYIISIDDDLNFLSESPLELIDLFFEQNSKCAVISFAVFWGINAPKISGNTQDSGYRTKSYLGGANAIRRKSWNTIPDYPHWFCFYGAEDFASFHFFKKGWEIYYLPQIIAHHRVDVKFRKQNKDYLQRTRRSLRSSWYLYFIFAPLQLIPKEMFYSIYFQLKFKVFKGDLKSAFALLFAFCDLVINLFRIINNVSRFDMKEYKAFKKLNETKTYWYPNSVKNES